MAAGEKSYQQRGTLREGAVVGKTEASYVSVLAWFRERFMETKLYFLNNVKRELKVIYWNF